MVSMESVGMAILGCVVTNPGYSSRRASRQTRPNRGVASPPVGIASRRRVRRVTHGRGLGPQAPGSGSAIVPAMDVIEAIGNTPLIELKRVSAGLPVKV